METQEKTNLDLKSKNSFAHIKLKCVQTTKWECQTGIWIYESRVQNRGFEWQNTLGGYLSYMWYYKIWEEIKNLRRMIHHSINVC